MNKQIALLGQAWDHVLDEKGCESSINAKTLAVPSLQLSSFHSPCRPQVGKLLSGIETKALSSLFAPW